MPPQPTESQKVLRELLKRFPEIPTLTIAKKAYKENPELWPSQETCRTMVRYIRGNQGKEKRRRANKSQFRENGHQSDGMPRLPDTLDGKDGWQNYVVDTPGPWGIIGDIHIPFHNLAAVKAALKEGKRRGWKGILINGDLFDMPGSFSRFSHDPRDNDFARDLYMGRQFFDCLRDLFPKARKIFKFGNHDLHYSRYLWTKCPELLDVEATWLENLVECKKYGIEVVKDNEPVVLGKLNTVHGHEFGNGATSPVSPAKTIYDRLHESTVCSHWHRISNFGEPFPISDHYVRTWSVGCLCGLKPKWLRNNKWVNGAATAEIYKDGAYEVDNFLVRHGEKWS